MKEQNGNGFAPSIAQAIEEMKAFQGDSFSLEHINLAELERRTGVSAADCADSRETGFKTCLAAQKVADIGSQNSAVILACWTACCAKASRIPLPYWSV